MYAQWKNNVTTCVIEDGKVIGLKERNRITVLPFCLIKIIKYNFP